MDRTGETSHADIWRQRLRGTWPTAGASGIGFEIAKAFAATGAHVNTCDINRPALDNAAASIPGLLTGLCDVGERASVEAMVAEIAQALGGIDALVNNAEIDGPTKSVQDLVPDEWEAVLRIDLTGTFNVTRNAMANRSIKHLVDPADMAALAVFLASSAAKSISGQVIPIGGDYQRN